MTPSSPGQMEFAKYLKSVLDGMGLEDVELRQQRLFIRHPSGQHGEAGADRGIHAHIDTSPDMSGRHVPAHCEELRRRSITLNEKEQIVLSPGEFPELRNYMGEDLIVTDGTTLLGADDKAGVAEIITAVAYLQSHPEIKHGKIRIGFNPDEEIGLGAHKFDVEKFGCEFAYTMDGGAVGEPRVRKLQRRIGQGYDQGAATSIPAMPSIRWSIPSAWPTTS